MTRRPPGEGSIFKRGDGVWTGVLDISQPGEPRRRKTIYGHSRAEIQRELGKLRREYERTGDLPTANLTVGAWMTKWLDDIAEDRLKPSTMTSHRQKVRLYITPLIGSVRLDRLTPDHIRGMYKTMAARCKVCKQDRADCNEIDPKPHEFTGLSMNTRHQTHAVLSRGLTLAVREGKATRNPALMMDGPPQETPDIDVLNPTEIAALIEAMVGDRMESRWLSALHIGIRQGEALGMGWDQVDLTEGTMTVLRALSRQAGRGLVMGTPKSKKAYRTVPLTDPLARSLERRHAAWEQERKEPSHTDLGLVWGQPNGRPQDPRRDWQAWKDLLAKAEVRDVRLHDARHAAATALGALGVPPQVIQAILGHAQITTTMRYTHTDLTAMREAVGRLDRPALD